jgi:hypothetical protein
VGQSTVTADVKDHVVAVLAVGELLAGVVDDVVGAEGSYQIHLHTPVTSALNALAICDAWLAAVDAAVHSPARPGCLTLCSTRP